MKEEKLGITEREIEKKQQKRKINDKYKGRGGGVERKKNDDSKKYESKGKKYKNGKKTKKNKK